MRKVFLDDLPKITSGTHKDQYDWKNSIGCFVKFIYDEITGEIKIIDYQSDNLYIQYLDYKIDKITTDSFKKCKLSYILKKISREFKLEIGSNVVDNNRNITIIDRKYKSNKDYQKWYRYRCNTCGWSGGWIDEVHLLHNIGCSCCSGHTVVEGINDIPTTAPWMVKYFQGGYDEAKMYTKSSSKRIKAICPECGKTKDNPIIIASIFKYHSIGCSCSDGTSYPEKFLSNFLSQLHIDYMTQATKKVLPWIKSGIRYDFYIPCKKYLIESHGDGHYNVDFHTCKGGRSLQEEQENDKFKEQLAKENGIEKYIVLDCRKSELEWIKKSVMESVLPTLFNFTEDDIDWMKCHEFALSNVVKLVCDFYSSHRNISLSDIGKHFNLHYVTIRTYLKRGALLNWCEYDSKLALKKHYDNVRNNKSKSVIIMDKDIVLGEFESCHFLDEVSKDLFGIKLHYGGISKACRNNVKYKGFTFKYIR